MAKRGHDHGACRACKGIFNAVCKDCGIPLGQTMQDRCYVCLDIAALRIQIASLNNQVYLPPVPWYGLR